jgi:hypothetical protein
MLERAVRPQTTRREADRRPVPGGDNWTWQGEATRCTGEFSADGRTLAAHHERRTENGSWAPSMEVVLTKVE